MQSLPHIESIYHLYFVDLLLLFSFISSLENQYMNHHVQSLLYDICITSVELDSKIKSLPRIDFSKLEEVTQRFYQKLHLHYCRFYIVAL